MAKFKREFIRCTEEKGNRKVAANFGVHEQHSNVVETQGSEHKAANTRK
jgi:hypothetical protein